VAGESGHAVWPPAGLAIDAQRVMSAYERVRPTLVRDPLFAGNAADFGVSVEELDRRMGQPPDHLDGGALWDWLGGADQYRWAGLRVLAEAFASLGRRTIAGALIGSLWDYSMVAAAEVEFRDGVTAGEVLALNSVRCPGTLYLSDNDYSCRAPLYSGGVLVDFERLNAFSRVEVDRRITDWDFAAAAHALGLSADDDLPRAYAAKLLATG
jgi:hypothetical protein